MASKIPKELKKAITDAWAGVEAKVALLKGYTFVEGHYRYSDVSGSEHPAVTNYTTGGEILTDSSAYVSTINAMYDASDKSWTNVTLTNVNYAVVYNTATGLIIALLDLGGSFSVVNGIFTLQWSTSGIVQVTQA